MVGSSRILAVRVARVSCPVGRTGVEQGKRGETTLCRCLDR